MLLLLLVRGCRNAVTARCVVMRKDRLRVEVVVSVLGSVEVCLDLVESRLMTLTCSGCLPDSVVMECILVLCIFVVEIIGEVMIVLLRYNA